MIRRFFTSSTLALKRTMQYNPAIIPPPSALSKDREWLKIRPDPPVKNKTIASALPDGSTFHEIVKKDPLYAFVSPNAGDEILEKVLPPRAEDYLHGLYPPRMLSKSEMKEIIRLRKEDHAKWTVRELANKFKCSKSQVVRLTKLRESPRRKDRKWRWWYGKRYASGQVDYYKKDFNRWLCSLSK